MTRVERYELLPNAKCGNTRPANADDPAFLAAWLETYGDLECESSTLLNRCFHEVRTPDAPGEGKNRDG